MADPHSSKPGSRPAASASAAKAPDAGDKSPAPAGRPADRSGRIVHDERGNAIWHWVKDTARIAIDSTSRLLRRLEVPELKIEDTHNEELRLESDRDSGGGYDPYGGSTPRRATGAGTTSSARSGTPGVTHDPTPGRPAGAVPHGSSSQGSGPHGSGPSGAGDDPYGKAGGAGYDPYGKGGSSGYDPYGKGVTPKPTRKR